MFSKLDLQSVRRVNSSGPVGNGRTCYGDINDLQPSGEASGGNTLQVKGWVTGNGEDNTRGCLFEIWLEGKNNKEKIMAEIGFPYSTINFACLTKPSR